MTSLPDFWALSWHGHIIFSNNKSLLVLEYKLYMVVWKSWTSFYLNLTNIALLKEGIRLVQCWILSVCKLYHAIYIWNKQECPSIHILKYDLRPGRWSMGWGWFVKYGSLDLEWNIKHQSINFSFRFQFLKNIERSKVCL